MAKLIIMFKEFHSKSGDESTTTKLIFDDTDFSSAGISHLQKYIYQP
jgi:hypothetical protein